MFWKSPSEIRCPKTYLLYVFGLADLSDNEVVTKVYLFSNAISASLFLR